VQAAVREGNKMGFHYRPVEDKDLLFRQVEATQEQTRAIYALVDNLRVH
jgi:hypothetical protein